MYLYLGGDHVVKTADVLGIFDLDNTSVSRDTRDFLRRAEQEGRVVNVSPELPKSFLVAGPPPGTVYICQISAATLYKRVQEMNRRTEETRAAFL